MTAPITSASATMIAIAAMARMTFRQFGSRGGGRWLKRLGRWASSKMLLEVYSASGQERLRRAANAAGEAMASERAFSM
jgi:hypothetical protein